MLECMERVRGREGVSRHVLGATKAIIPTHFLFRDTNEGVEEASYSNAFAEEVNNFETTKPTWGCPPKPFVNWARR